MRCMARLVARWTLRAEQELTVRQVRAWPRETDWGERAVTGKPRSVRAEQRIVSSAMRANGCSWRQVADEFVSRWGYTYLQAFRLVHGLSQEQAAERYNLK